MENTPPIKGVWERRGKLARTDDYTGHAADATESLESPLRDIGVPSPAAEPVQTGASSESKTTPVK
jgi:hypothetical protein